MKPPFFILCCNDVGQLVLSVQHVTVLSPPKSIAYYYYTTLLQTLQAFPEKNLLWGDLWDLKEHVGADIIRPDASLYLSDTYIGTPDVQHPESMQY